MFVKSLSSTFVDDNVPMSSRETVLDIDLKTQKCCDPNMVTRLSVRRLASRQQADQARAKKEIEEIVMDL